MEARGFLPCAEEVSQADPSGGSAAGYRPIDPLCLHAHSLLLEKVSQAAGKLCYSCPVVRRDLGDKGGDTPALEIAAGIDDSEAVK